MYLVFDYDIIYSIILLFWREVRVNFETTVPKCVQYTLEGSHKSWRREIFGYDFGVRVFSLEVKKHKLHYSTAE